MLKFASRGVDGKPVVILGLTEPNVERMKGGEPVHVKATEVALLAGVDVHIAITYGDTEEDILAALREQGITLPEGIENAIARAREQRSTEFVKGDDAQD